MCKTIQQEPILRTRTSRKASLQEFTEGWVAAKNTPRLFIHPKSCSRLLHVLLGLLNVFYPIHYLLEVPFFCSRSSTSRRTLYSSSGHPLCLVDVFYILWHLLFAFKTLFFFLLFVYIIKLIDFC